MLLPREHGAWGLLLQPFLCAAILGRRWDWLFVPMTVLLLIVFVMREPLVILARQRWTWKETKPESATARRYLFWQLPLCAALALVCFAFLPVIPLAILAGFGTAITVLATSMALHNRQRSIALQIVSSLGLSSTGLLAALVAARGLPDWSWLVCGFLALHTLASILVVRTRLELRAGAKPTTFAGWAWAFQGMLVCAAIGLVISGSPDLAAPIGLTILVSALELARLRTSGALSEPLRHVGFRALAASLGHSALSVAVLW
jgi:hypothetical protein